MKKSSITELTDGRYTMRFHTALQKSILFSCWETRNMSRGTSFAATTLSDTFLLFLCAIITTTFKTFRFRFCLYNSVQKGHGRGGWLSRSLMLHFGRMELKTRPPGSFFCWFTSSRGRCGHSRLISSEASHFENKYDVKAVPTSSWLSAYLVPGFRKATTGFLC